MKVPGVVPVVWSSPRLMTMNRGRLPFFSNSRNSLRKTSTLSVSRTTLAGLGDAVLGADVADQAGDAPFHLERAVGLADAVAVLAVAAVGQAVAGAGVPEVAEGALDRSPSSSSSTPSRLGVGQGPVPGDVVGVVGHRRPGVAVGRDVAVAVEVVEQHELLGQLVVVGRDLARRTSPGLGSPLPRGCRRRPGRRSGSP